MRVRNEVRTLLGAILDLQKNPHFDYPEAIEAMSEVSEDLGNIDCITDYSVSSVINVDMSAGDRYSIQVTNRDYPLPLPFEHYVAARVQSRRNETFVLVVRDVPIMPFVVYALTPEGDCIDGDYCETRSKAEQRLIERAGLGVPA